ncbi:MAG: hypothetical protein INF91_02835 [Alphaproteobacteria bacterium]|nr:hypothetical protein [Alphaproteobacteria bacterium]
MQGILRAVAALGFGLSANVATAGTIDILTEWRSGAANVAAAYSGNGALWRGGPTTTGAAFYGAGAPGQAYANLRAINGTITGADSIRASALWSDLFTLDGGGALAGSMTVSGYFAGRGWSDGAGTLLNSGPQSVSLSGLAGCPGGICEASGPTSVAPNATSTAPFLYNAAWMIPFSITVPVMTGESFMMRLAATAGYDSAVGSMSSVSWAVVRSLDLPAGWTLTASSALAQTAGPGGEARFGFAPVSVPEGGAAGLFALGLLGLLASRRISRASA